MRHSLVFIFLSLILFTSCKNEDDDVIEDIEEQDLTFLYHEISSLNCIKEVFASGQQICFSDSIFRFNSLNNSAIITTDSITIPDSTKIRLDYGSSVVLCKDGKFRSGLIEFSFNKNSFYCDSNNVISVNLTNYRVDSLLLNGIMQIVNQGIVDDSLSWNILTNMGITTNQGISISTVGDYQINLSNTSTCFINYNEPLVFNNARFILKGTSHGTNCEDRNYYTNSDNTISFGFDCLADTLYSTNNLFTTGTLLYQSGAVVSVKKCTIYFGNGNCDRNYTLRCNGYSLTDKFR